MAYPDSVESLSEAETLFNESVSWRDDTTGAKAKKRLAALDWFSINRPQFSAERGTSFNFDAKALRDMRGELVAFLDATSTSSRTRFTLARPR